MKVILINVSSLDSKSTKWARDNVYDWSSAEDFKHFQKVKSENNLLVMGSGTFDRVKNNEVAGLKPEKERLRIILTHNPKRYIKYHIKGQMEFSSELPDQLIKRLEKEGYQQMLLVGGTNITTSFFRKNLIDEVWMTIEPKIFGCGKPLLEEGAFDINLKLLSCKKLNSQGTLLLKYKILK